MCIKQLTDSIKFYMNYRHVAAAIQSRVIDCVTYIQKHTMVQSEAVIMASVPTRLRAELAAQMHADTLHHVPLLVECM
jgi:hypothetical protein